MPTCQYCGREDDDLREVMTGYSSTEQWCEECCIHHASICDCCAEYISEEATNSDGYITLCYSCLQDSYYRCEDCRRYVHEDDVYWYACDPYCEDCEPSCEPEEGINEYSLKPAPEFHFGAGESRSDHHIFLGIELEAGGLDSFRDAVDEAHWVYEAGEGFIYCKEDASIPRSGFETVTHPGTLKFHEEFAWEKILKHVSESGLRSHDIDRCGLHIHVNKDALTSRQWLLADWFVNTFQNFWQAVGRRGSVQYAYYKSKEMLDEEEAFCCKFGRRGDRYVAVNFCNDETVEFRFWRGTLKYSTFIACLQLQHALIEWIPTLEPVVVLDKYEPLHSFSRFVRSHYPAAYEYAKSKDAWNALPM